MFTLSLSGRERDLLVLLCGRDQCMEAQLLGEKMKKLKGKKPKNDCDLCDKGVPHRSCS